MTNIADGFWWTDPASGERKWQTGDMLLARMDARAKKQRAALEAVVEAIGKSFGEERRRNRAEIEALKAEIAELRAAMPLRCGQRRARRVMEDSMTTKTEVTKRGDAELVEKTFAVPIETLPAALAEAITELAKLANRMTPDDISVSLDLPAGTMSFRAYKRAPVQV